MIFKTEYEKFEPYITKDGSIIREFMHPSVHGNPNQSPAEATVPAGGKTLLHKHRITEEIYHPSFTSGSQKIGDFLGVALQVQQHEVLFASLKRTNLQK